MAIDYLHVRGVRSGIARALNISHQAVAKWTSNGIPSGRVIEVCIATGWRITPHELRPDLYPNPEDGLPRTLPPMVDGRSGNGETGNHGSR